MYALLIEDDPDYADIIRHVLERNGHETVSFTEMAEAVRFAARKTPYIAIIDIMLPDGTGIDACKQLRAFLPELPLIFLSSLNRVGDIVEALRAGGDDYLTKPFHPQELEARVNALLRRRNAVQSGDDVVKHQAGALTVAADKVFFGERPVACTAIEAAILRELVIHAERPLSHAFLTERVWGYSAVTDAVLLKGHVSSIRKKLRQVGAPDTLVTTVHHVGYVLRQPVLQGV